MYFVSVFCMGHVHLIIYRVFWCVCHVCCVMKHFTFALSGSGYCHIIVVVVRCVVEK
jgi:hypothetical protein